MVMMAENILPSEIVHALIYISKFYDVPQIVSLSLTIYDIFMHRYNYITVLYVFKNT